MAGWELRVLNPEGYVMYHKTLRGYELRAWEMHDATQFAWRVSNNDGYKAEGYAGALDLAMQTAEARVPTATQTYIVNRASRADRMHRPDPPTVTIPAAAADLDAQRLAASAAALPDGLRVEFILTMDRKPPAFYITKRTTPATHWAVFALHIDPIYGQYTYRALPRNARRWLGRTPWATTLMIAHEVPAWCEVTYPNPGQLDRVNLVSDLASITRATIDPILYGVMVAGRKWGFVPLADWKL
jgi:hypothetical protein